jgi:hypothetical protein
MTDQLRPQRHSLKRTARDLLRGLDHVPGPDDPETRLTLCHLTAAIEVRRNEWLPR